MRVGVYLRISHDPEGTSTATARQEEDCRKYAASHGWDVTDVFRDEDVSAYQRTVKRPEFERMLAAIRDRQIDGVLAWKMDRLSRRQRDLVRLDEECEAVAGAILTVVEGIDTRQASGRFVGELLVSMARMESENSSVRVARKHLERAAAGKPSTGGNRMFGYSRDRMTILPDEAALIREASRRILAGESLRGVCRDWRERGVKTTTGRRWSVTPLRHLLQSAALAGQRDLHGVVSAGTWPAIITPAEHGHLRAVLEAPSRFAGRGARRYLLTGGLARCGRCGGALVGRAGKYTCSKQPNNHNCGKVARRADLVEELVRESVLVALDGVDIRKYMEEPSKAADGLLEAIRGDEQALLTLEDDYRVERVIGRPEYFRSRDTLKGRIDANRARLGKANGHATLVGVVGAGETVRRLWAGRTLDWRRAIVAALVDKVEVLPYPAGQTKKVFDPSLINMTWRF